LEFICQGEEMHYEGIKKDLHLDVWIMTKISSDGLRVIEGF